jgi:hypothetical protein
MRVPCAMQGIAIPTHTMFTEDYIREAAEDNVLQTSTADGTFADLGISPQRIDVGLPIEHVRHYRVGGYDVGARSFPFAPNEPGSPSMSGPLHPACNAAPAFVDHMWL